MFDLKITTPSAKFWPRVFPAAVTTAAKLSRHEKVKWFTPNLSY